MARPRSWPRAAQEAQRARERGRRPVTVGNYNYRLTFGGTRKTLYAVTLKNALADARYWTAFGQKRVCIDRRLPSGAFKRMRCIERKA